MPAVCTHFCNIEVYPAPLHLMLCSELDTDQLSCAQHQSLAFGMSYLWLCCTLYHYNFADCTGQHALGLTTSFGLVLINYIKETWVATKDLFHGRLTTSFGLVLRLIILKKHGLQPRIYFMVYKND